MGPDKGNPLTTRQRPKDDDIKTNFDRLYDNLREIKSESPRGHGRLRYSNFSATHANTSSRTTRGHGRLRF